MHALRILPCSFALSCCARVTSQERIGVVQVPVAVDGPPVATNDSFVVPLNAQTKLSVLDNDSAAYGSLTVVSTTSSTHGTAVVCPDGSCVAYTPSLRFMGYDELTYTARDLRGRTVTARALVRIATTPPRLLGAARHGDLQQGLSQAPFAGATLTYDDAVWRLTANVSLELDTHAGASAEWPAGALALGGGNGTSVAALSQLLVAPRGEHAVGAVLEGSKGEMAVHLESLTVAAPPHYSGVGIARLRLCSEWDECSVRALPALCMLLVVLAVLD